MLPNGFVRQSERLFSELTWAKEHARDAIASRTRWHAIDRCFFFSMLEGVEVFSTTLLLSPNISAGPCYWCAQHSQGVSVFDHEVNGDPRRHEFGSAC